MLADLLPQLMATTFQPIGEGKLCSKCNEWKPYVAFSRSNRHGRAKYQRWCKECLGMYRKGWRVATGTALVEAK